MTDCFEPKSFIRHNRQLRALQIVNQAWFCLQDIARLMGRPLDERATLKLDPDQRRSAWLTNDGQTSKQLLISESGLFAMLVHHYVPENRALRHWLTHDVLPTLRDSPGPYAPSLKTVRWPRSSVRVLEWQGEHWVRLENVPHLMDRPSERISSLWKRSTSFWRGKLEA